MFNVIKNIITGKTNNKTHQSGKDPELKKHVAAGVLLLEAAHIDDECSDAEMEHIVATLKEKFDLPDSVGGDMLDMIHTEREQALDLWQFTRHINQHFSTAEKTAVLEDVWRIILLDGKLDKHEDHYAHKLADLLHLSHGQLIDAKLKAREQLTG